MRRAITIAILFRLYHWATKNFVVITKDGRYLKHHDRLMGALYHQLEMALHDPVITIHQSALR